MNFNSDNNGYYGSYNTNRQTNIYAPTTRSLKQEIESLSPRQKDNLFLIAVVSTVALAILGVFIGVGLVIAGTVLYKNRKENNHGD